VQNLLDAFLSVSTGLDVETTLHRIVEVAADLVDARYGALGVLDEQGAELARFVHTGMDEQARARIGELPRGRGILGELIHHPEPLRLADLHEHPSSVGFPPHHPPMRTFLGVPIRVRGRVFGNLYLTDKTTAAEFTERDEELAVGLAGAAAVAIEHARLYAQLEDLALTSDRERIARDLHDTVIQRLFATGMSLQSTKRLVRSDSAAAVARIEQAVDDLDVTIKDIRTAIFGLEQHLSPAAGLRAEVLATVRDAVPALGIEPRVMFDGAIDATVTRDVGDELVATHRQALSNVARHAGATAVDVEVVAAGDVLLRVSDNGIGLSGSARPEGHGLRNMAERAARVGGTFETSPGRPSGTVVTWRAPVGEA
jgi:signal transduction histidine kinase